MIEQVEQKLYSRAFLLSLFTIFYNVVEGVVSMILGYQDETLTLFGFGADSIIEVMSGMGIAIMVSRIRRNPLSPKSVFEVQALKITGSAFYFLAVGLLAGMVVSIISHHKPEATIWGVAISLVSVAVMLWLMNEKVKTGKLLNSEPIVADANCTRVCIYMSLVLLASSLIYELTGFAWADLIGSAGLVYFSFSEGKEAFEKAKGKNCCCHHCQPS